MRPYFAAVIGFNTARMAQNAGAGYVVGGNVQVVGEQVRITATVVDRSGAAIGSAKVTGESRKLFDLEDGLADQIRDDISASRARQHVLTTPVPTVQSSGPIRVAQQPSVPLGTVPVQYSSSALRDGRDRYIYQVPVYGCYGEYGFGAWGCYGLGGFCCGRGGVLDGGYSTGGTHSLAW